MGALLALARTVALSTRGGGGGLARRAFGLLPAVGAGAGGVAAGEALFGGNGDGTGRRRRRRKALTNDDVRTALTIASAISKKAAENFVLMRVRGQ